MKRSLFNLLAAASLALCVATLVLWVRSYFAMDVIRGYPYFPNRFLISARGQLILHGNETFKSGPARIDPAYDAKSGTLDFFPVWILSPNDPGLKWHFAFVGFLAASSRGGFVHAGSATSFYLAQWEIGLPDWAVAMPLAVLPFVAIRRISKRRAPGLCPQCHYDLRATPTRCPECGTLPTSTA